MLSPENELSGFDSESENVQIPSASTQDSVPMEQPVETSAMTQEDPVLFTAREHSMRGDMDLALHAYSHMIQRGRSLEAVISDLAHLIKTHSQNALLWKTLGDALARSGNSDHAEKSYAQAEKLMRA